MSLNKRQNNKPLNILNFNCARLKARPQVTCLLENDLHLL